MHEIKGKLAPLPKHLSMKACVTGDKASAWNHVASDLPHYELASDFFSPLRNIHFIPPQIFFCNIFVL
jgi:hypothetical protein